MGLWRFFYASGVVVFNGESTVRKKAIEKEMKKMPPEAVNGSFEFAVAAAGVRMAVLDTAVFGLCGGSLIALLVWRLTGDVRGITAGIVSLLLLSVGWMLAVRGPRTISISTTMLMPATTGSGQRI